MVFFIAILVFVDIKNRLLVFYIYLNLLKNKNVTGNIFLFLKDIS